jgi:hypothetical protein
MKQELEEIEAVKMRQKQVCYQMTRNDVMQKAETVKTSSSKVNSSTLMPEELVHMVNVFVASKYGLT